MDISLKTNFSATISDDSILYMAKIETTKDTPKVVKDVLHAKNFRPVGDHLAFNIVSQSLAELDRELGELKYGIYHSLCCHHVAKYEQDKNSIDTKGICTIEPSTRYAAYKKGKEPSVVFQLILKFDADTWLNSSVREYLSSLNSDFMRSTGDRAVVIFVDGIWIITKQWAETIIGNVVRLLNLNKKDEWLALQHKYYPHMDITVEVDSNPYNMPDKEVKPAGDSDGDTPWYDEPFEA